MTNLQLGLLIGADHYSSSASSRPSQIRWYNPAPGRPWRRSLGRGGRSTAGSHLAPASVAPLTAPRPPPALVYGLGSQVRRRAPRLRHVPVLRRLARHRLDLRDDRGGEHSRPAAAPAVSQAPQSLLREPPGTPGHHAHVYVQPCRDHRVLQPLRGQQHDLGPDHLSVRRGVNSEPAASTRHGHRQTA